jgi:hypothetical protein
VSKARETEMNWSKARDRIDRGETGDKIAVGDPAAVPFGADAEAGGASTAKEYIVQSVIAERAGSAAQAAAHGRTAVRPRRALLGLALAAIALVCVVAAIAVALVP